MTFEKHSTAQTAPRYAAFRPIRLFREVAIWNSAWREYHRLQRLDGDALRDMGLSGGACRSVTIAQIAARIRAGS